jgi:hypothetical protein
MADSYPAINGTGLVTTGAAQTISGAKTFLAGSATSIPITIQAFSGQNGSLTEWRDSAGILKLAVRADGNIYSTASGANNWFNNTTGTTNQFQPYAATHVPVLVRGTASQSANLQEWQDSAGTILAGISAGGMLFSQSTSYLSSGGWGAAISATPYHNSAPGIIVRSRASQTGNLQEWQNSAGTVLSAIAYNGRLTYNAFDTAGAPGAYAGSMAVYVGGTLYKMPFYVY